MSSTSEGADLSDLKGLGSIINGNSNILFLIYLLQSGAIEGMNNEVIILVTKHLLCTVYDRFLCLNVCTKLYERTFAFFSIVFEGAWLPI